jgi:hypothetical protein
MRVIKPTRCINFSHLFLEWNSTCFGQFLVHHQEFFIVFTAMIYVIQVCRQHARMLSVNLYDIYHCCVQWKTPDDGQRNCPKYVECHSRNKFEKLVHLVGFIIRNVLSILCQISTTYLEGLWDLLNSYFIVQWKLYLRNAENGNSPTNLNWSLPYAIQANYVKMKMG